jgi:putative Mg2+ transporter-C (MgtC) family protein
MDFTIILDYISNNFQNFAKISLSALLGFLVGLDREYKNKPAGIKTYMFVSVACTLLTIVSIEGVTKFSDLHVGVRMDPLRLAAQIVSGLGFLGAGVILKNGLKVQGLTSAAMIFLVGGIGIGIGSGFYGLVIFSTFLSMVLARLGDRIERKKVKKERLAS